MLEAVCFGAYHFAPEFGRWNIPNMLGVAVFGLAAGIAATRWRRLGPGIVAHALLNTLHVIAVFTTR
ncbi:MAG: CPBP family intramembrane metalloprotease [Actinobacteria bacterium]|nr:CPBP family intramembrane metalloprotease [Actinomycetota bacterium]